MAIDLPATAPLCTGLALDKINQEMKLTEGQTIDLSTRRPDGSLRTPDHAR